jgi:hypothetical protein
MTLAEPNASKFHVFCCTIFAEVPDKLRRKQGEKAFRGALVDYRTDTLAYRVYNPVTRRITTSMQVMFQTDVHGVFPSPKTDPLIIGNNDANDVAQKRPMPSYALSNVVFSHGPQVVVSSKACHCVLCPCAW